MAAPAVTPAVSASEKRYIRMPPGRADDGLVAAQEIRRRRHPAIGVLVLSHHVDSRYAARLLEEVPERAGYLLKSASPTSASSSTRSAGSTRASA